MPPSGDDCLCLNRDRPRRRRRRRQDGVTGFDMTSRGVLPDRTYCALTDGKIIEARLGSPLSCPLNCFSRSASRSVILPLNHSVCTNCFIPWDTEPRGGPHAQPAQGSISSHEHRSNQLVRSITPHFTREATAWRMVGSDWVDRPHVAMERGRDGEREGDDLMCLTKPHTHTHHSTYLLPTYLVDTYSLIPSGLAHEARQAS